MSMQQKQLRCCACGHIEPGGLWDVESSLQPPQVLKCPKCGELALRSIEALGLFADNAFAVRLDVDGDIHCSLPTTASSSYQLKAVFPRAYALNFAAWLARVADPKGKDFDFLSSDVARRAAAKGKLRDTQ